MNLILCNCNMPMLAPRNFKFRPSDKCPIHAEYVDRWDSLLPAERGALMLVTVQVERERPAAVPRDS